MWSLDEEESGQCLNGFDLIVKNVDKFWDHSHKKAKEKSESGTVSIVNLVRLQVEMVVDYV